MVNKNRFSIKNTKKVLHKVGKHWVVVSAVLLGLVAGGATVTTANADVNNVSANHSNIEAVNPNETNNASQDQTAKVPHIANEIKAYRDKGIANDGLNAVGHHLKSGANVSIAKSGYSNLASMANASNVARFSNSAESLGSTTDSTSNTWFGEFNSASSYAKDINDNNTNPKVSNAFNDINDGLNYKLPTSMNVSSLKLTSSEANSAIQGYANSHPNLLKQFITSPSGIQQEIEDALGSKSVDNVQISAFHPSYSWSGFSESTSVLGNPTVNNVSVGSTTISANASIPSNTTVSNIINSGTNVTLNSVSVNSGSKLNLSASLSANINYNIFGKLTATVNIGSITKSATASISNNNVYYNGTLIKSLGSSSNLSNKSIHTTLSNINIPSMNYSIAPFASSRYSTGYLANLLDGKDNSELNPVDAMISKEIHSMTPSLLAQKHHDASITASDSSEATSYINKVADMIHAGDQMLGSSNMSANYNGIVSELATLPSDNESAESSALNSASNYTNKLADEYSGITSGYDSKADQSYVINNLRRAGNAMNSEANSMSNAMNTINTDSSSVSNSSAIANRYSAQLNTDIGVGEEPNYSLNGSSATNNDAVKAMNSYLGTIHNDSSVINSARTAYANWADQDNGFESSVANSASSDANTALGKAKALLDMTKSSQPSGNTSNPQHSGSNISPVSPIITPTSMSNSYATPSSASETATPASTTNNNTNNISSIATKKHVAKANYVKVNKELQLHTSPNFTKRNAFAIVKPSTTFKIERAVTAHNGALRYEVKYNRKNYYITANKHWVSTFTKKATKHMNNARNYVHYRYAKVVKALQLHTSAKFTKRNGVMMAYPSTELRINRIVKNHKLVRYEVRYQGHNYFITANHNYTVNAYLQKHNFRKHGHKAVKVIKRLNEYRKPSATKRSFARHFYRGSVLHVKRVITIGKGEMTRLELTNGRYVTANKNFVKII